MTDKESYNLQLSMLNDSYKIVNTNLADLIERISTGDNTTHSTLSGGTGISIDDSNVISIDETASLDNLTIENLSTALISNSSGALQLKSGANEAVTIDANSNIENSGGLTSSGDVRCANLYLTGNLSVPGDTEMVGDLKFTKQVGVVNIYSNAPTGNPVSSPAHVRNLGISLVLASTGGSNTGRLFFGAGYHDRRFIMETDQLEVVNILGGGLPEHMYLQNNGGYVISTHAVQQSSDDRIKFNETNITNGLEVIRKLSPEKYIKKLPTQQEGVEEAGFIAQEVLQIPELKFAVKHPEKEIIAGDPNTRYYTLHYDCIFTYAVAGLKQLDTIVQQQAQLISSLEARLSALESK